MSKGKQQESQHYCSFCERRQDKVERLFGGPKAQICDACILEGVKMLGPEYGAERLIQALANDVAGEGEEANPYEVRHLPKPKEIKEVLDTYVVGQDLAKKVLSVAVYNHYTRLKYQNNLHDVELSKSNILLIGPTGSGKTLLAQTLARVLEVPFVIADATSLTEAGYVGSDVETVLQSLLAAAEFDPKLAETGIVFIDELDKISRKSENMSITRDVSGEGVQQSLLKIIEGTAVSVPITGKRKHPQSDTIEIDTTNILFVCSGAFDGLEKIIQHRRNIRSQIGFSASFEHEATAKNNSLKELEQDDLIRYGLIPELVGRLPVITVVDELDETAMLKILTEPKNALTKQFIKQFSLENAQLVFTDKALEKIVTNTLALGVGARGLRSVLEELLLESMFELPSMNDIDTVLVDTTDIEGESSLVVSYEDSTAS